MNTTENDKTIASYEQNADRYAAATKPVIDGPLKEWLDGSVDGFPHDVVIFEIGSGTGRDALYLRSLGYDVACSDATLSFRQQLAKQGLEVSAFNLLTDDFTEKYDVILANAVLLHITKKQMSRALKKIHDALTSNGRFAFTLKKGEGEAWTDHKVSAPRYFCYWQEQEIVQELKAAGFNAISVVESGPYDARWLQIIATA